MKRSRAQAPRQPGRPCDDQNPDAREALLASASRLYAEHGPGGVTLRRLADEAGVTPAMVHYYFRNKEGLYEALVIRTWARVLKRVRAITAEGGGPDKVVEVLYTTVTAEPWFPALVLSEVFMEGGRLREHFLQDYGSSMAKLMTSMIQSRIESGAFRKDLDPTLSFVSLMSMATMPFVTRPVLERLLGFEYDEDFVRRLADHTHRLFLQGVRS